MTLNQLGRVLKRLGYESKRIAGKGTRGYILIEKTADSINANRRIGAS